MSNTTAQYVHTTGDIIAPNQLKLIDSYVNNYLFSLIKGLRQGNFGFNTLHSVSQEIKKYRQVLGSKRKFFIDSGGYSIIVGEVSPRDTFKFIECYNMFLEKDALENCDYIFSLDIPIFLKYPEHNNIKTIYEANSRSISESVKVLNKIPELYNKYVFVWQFKLLKQYNIWKRVFRENLENNSYIKNFAIGGLVSLRGVTGIKFSPFIAMVYKILKLIHDKNLNYTSLIHILGVYHLHDRVIMPFLHKLFNEYYLKDKNCKTQITYDTVNYALSGLYKLKEQIIFIPENDEYISGYAHELIDKIHLVIPDEDVLKVIKTDLNCVINGKNVKNTTVTSLLNVIAQTTIDKIIVEEIDKNNIVELFVNSSNFNKFKNQILPILMNLEKKYPLIFGNRTKKNLLNFQYCYAFNDWWINDRSEEKLEKLIEKFIQLIDFPFDINQ
ncbi:MAG: hypothetical protein WC188_03980 [Candidatus Caldatribacteriota bacterium]|nr:hypothetical protein [Patescibacteria group bacterium]